MRSVVLAALILAACAPSAPRETPAPSEVPDPPRVIETPPSARAGGVAVTLDREVYGPRDTVAVTFENQGQALAYVLSAGCSLADGSPLPTFGIEKRVGDAWESGHAGYVCGAMYQQPRLLELGDRVTVRFAVGVAAPLPPGTYRYRFVTDVRAPSVAPRIVKPVSAAFRVTG